MGRGSFDAASYASSTTTRLERGESAFSYSDATRAKPAQEQKIHPNLDPRLIKGVRESRDNEEHPESVPVIIALDVTGSNIEQAMIIQKKLPNLMDMLIKKALRDPQICFCGVGDYFSDRFPFQVSQFESDNRIDEQLRLTFLEGGGGGGLSESYDTAYYFAAYKTACDAWEKRGKKGYLVTIGDELPYRSVSGDRMSLIYSAKPTETIQSMSFEALLKAAEERWEIFHVLTTRGAKGNMPEVQNGWKALLGQRVLLLDDSNLIVETIASQIAIMEGVEEGDLALEEGAAATVLKTVKPKRLVIV